MSMDSAEVDGVDFRHFGPTATRIFEVAAQHDSILCCLEVAMNQMDTKSLVSVMADEERCKLLYMFLRDGWLFPIVEQPIVASNC
jgi:hypothetical protein